MVPSDPQPPRPVSETGRQVTKVTQQDTSSVVHPRPRRGRTRETRVPRSTVGLEPQRPREHAVYRFCGCARLAASGQCRLVWTQLSERFGPSRRFLPRQHSLVEPVASTIPLKADGIGRQARLVPWSLHSAAWFKCPVEGIQSGWSEALPTRYPPGSSKDPPWPSVQSSRARCRRQWR